MKSLKSDTLDLIAAAVQHRLRNLFDDILLSRHHRLGATASRRPPMYRDSMGKDSDDLASMWDIEVEDDTAKILNVIARVEREEERAARRERTAREQQEQEEQEEEAARLAASQKDQEEGGDASAAEAKRKEKKRKRESAAANARNLPEEMQKKMTDASARHTLFGGNQKYAWLQGNTSTSGANGSSTPRSSTASKSKPTNASSPLTNSSSMLGPSGLNASISNFGNATTTAVLPDEYDPPSTIIWQDLLFALENERGSGAGKGTGAQAIYRSQALRRQ